MAPTTTGKHRCLVFIRQAKNIGELRFVCRQGDESRDNPINRIRSHSSGVSQERLSPDHSL
jgi:hypothetical protein